MVDGKKRFANVRFRIGPIRRERLTCFKKLIKTVREIQNILT
jgi:hypothetical protein